MLKVLFSEPTATFLERYEGLIDERMHKNHVIDQHVSNATGTVIGSLRNRSHACGVENGS
jgi:hypothetical protein